MTHSTHLPAGPILTRSLDHRRPLLAVRPVTPNQLHHWLRVVLDLHIPRSPLNPGASTPFDYLRHAFFQPPHHSPTPTSPDCVVWACRGGGKTFYAAVASLLDLLFKPTIEIKILGGSLDQSRRMHEYLRKFFERPLLSTLLDSKVTDRRLSLTNGSTVETLAQSHTSVRGARPQILRCDEVELFDPAVWRAAQLVTRSKLCAGLAVRGAVEALSTMHQPAGLMSRLIADATASPSLSSTTPPRRLFRWSALDVLERCPPSRPCDSCSLWPECRGRARRPPGALGAAGPGGHLLIDDAVALKARSDRASWDSEMLCLRPLRSDAVFPEFDPALHVAPFEPPLNPSGEPWLAGMDFGLRAPTVILWAFLDNSNTLRIIDERHESGRLLDSHIAALISGLPHPSAATTTNAPTNSPRPPWPIPAWIAVDPAGRQRNDQTGASAVETMRRAGLTIRSRPTSIDAGLRALRARLAPASGPPRLLIHPRCLRLIHALHSYHYPASDPHSLTPSKDGPDHAVDALRYLVATLDLPAWTRVNIENYL